MALETGVYQQDPFGLGCREFYTWLGGGPWGYDMALKEEDKTTLVEMFENNMDYYGLINGNWDSSSSSLMQNATEWDPNSSPEACTDDQFATKKSSISGEAPPIPVSASGRRKRRRTKSCKNKEELENQRMTHIAIERNRRKQMNDYLAAIRSLMPPSYVQRGDQASIVGGAINFVKELEQLLQTLEAQKKTADHDQHPNNGSVSPLFSDFFAFPQYSTRSTHSTNFAEMAHEPMAGNRSAIANIEVTMAESHANLKILKEKRPRQLLKMVAGLQCLRLNILHLNVTTVDQMVLYSLSVKVEDGCQLTTVDEIANAVHQLLGRTQEEDVLS